MNGMSETLLLPVPGLNVSQPWDVGRVRFHPAGAAAELIEAARAGPQCHTAPGHQQTVNQAAADLDHCAFAEVAVSLGEKSLRRSL
jgi:hypothetical protein